MGRRDVQYYLQSVHSKVSIKYEQYTELRSKTAENKKMLLKNQIEYSSVLLRAGVYCNHFSMLPVAICWQLIYLGLPFSNLVQSAKVVEVG